jgi:sugar-specific transcriptional regulator TrmB
MDKELQQLGLTRYETMIYLALLKEGSLTGRRISQKSKVPQGKTYEILKSLVAKGFVHERQGKLKEFSAVKPGIAIKNLSRQKINTITDLQQNLVLNLGKLYMKETVPSLTEKVQVLAGRDAVRAAVGDMIDRTEKEFCLMFTYEDMWSEVTRKFIEKQKKGKKIKNLGTFASTRGLRFMKQDLQRGLAVRYFPVEEIRLNIRDMEEAMLVMANPRNRKDRIGIHVHSPEFAKALYFYFDNLWKKSKKITRKTTLKQLQSIS